MFTELLRENIQENFESFTDHWIDFVVTIRIQIIFLSAVFEENQHKIHFHMELTCNKGRNSY